MFWAAQAVASIVEGQQASVRSQSLLMGSTEPYFIDIPNLWKKHYRFKRTLVATPIGGLAIVADFARHFPEGCK